MLNKKSNIKLIIFDDVFPNPLTAFRVTEFNAYLDYFKQAKIYSSSKSFEEDVEKYLKIYPRNKAKINKYDEKIEYKADLFYTVFLNNTFNFLPVFVRENTPFIFTLYPGGGFSLNDDDSDRKLEAILSSPLCKKVIVTQKVSYEYLVDKNFCTKEKIELIYGCVIPSKVFEKAIKDKNYYNRDKKTLDICFVANKYTERGLDKGYDVFIEVANKIVPKNKDVFFHVVGGYGPEDIDVSKIKKNIKFYGNLLTSDFVDFYRTKDIILSPNRAFVLSNGSFDGFPTGSCMEAGLNGVVVFVADPLKQNTEFSDESDIMIIDDNADDIVLKIEDFIKNPKALIGMSNEGRNSFWRVLNEDYQMKKRIEILDSISEDKLLRRVSDNLLGLNNIITKLKIDNFNKDKNINNLKKEVADKESHIKYQELQLSNLTKFTNEQNKKLERIYRALPFRIYFIFKNILKKILPEGSYGRRLILGIKDNLNKKETAPVENNITKENTSVDKGKKNTPSLNTGKRNILVIPSWYPTEEAPLVGTFFREQSHLMESEYGVKILFGEPNSRIKQKVLYTKNRLITPPEAVSFYYKNTFYFMEKHNFENMFFAYKKAFNDLLKSGWKPDLIHAHSTVYGGIIANYLGKEFGVPTLITEHQMFLLHNYSRLVKNETVKALSETNLVAAVSTDKMRAILMHGINCNPIVVGNLVDDKMFFIKKQDKSDNRAFEILIVAGSSYIKDLPTFLRSVKEITLRGHKDIHVTILGAGLWGGESYEGLVSDLGIGGYCEFIDSVPRGEMNEYYNKCDVFVSTSIAEGFQVSILEAMACGKPVVSTCHGGVEDVISPKNGILVKIRDYRAIADAIIKIKTGKILFNPETIRKIVVSSYGNEAFKKMIGNLYEKLIYESKL